MPCIEMLIVEISFYIMNGANLKYDRITFNQIEIFNNDNLQTNAKDNSLLNAHRQFIAKTNESIGDLFSIHFQKVSFTLKFY